MGGRQGGSRPKGVAGFLHCSDPGGLALWVGDVGVNVTYEEGPGHFPVHGCKEDRRETAAAKEGQDLDIPTAGSNNEGDGNDGDKEFNSLEAEHGRAIHWDAADSGPVRTGHPAARRAGDLAVVGTDGDKFEGSVREGGSSRGGTGNGNGF